MEELHHRGTAATTTPMPENSITSPQSSKAITSTMAKQPKQASNNNNKKDDRITPNTICFNAVLHAYAQKRQRRAAQKAEELLNRMEGLSETQQYYGQVNPDRISYASAITAWSRLGTVEGAQRAESIFLRMMNRHNRSHLLLKKENLRPDIWIVNAVMQAWIASSDDSMAERNERILNTVLTLKEKDNNTTTDKEYDEMIDQQVFQTVIYSWCQSGESHPNEFGSRAFAILEQMKTRGYKPTSSVFAWVLKALETQQRTQQQQKKNQPPMDYLDVTGSKIDKLKKELGRLERKRNK